MEDAQLGRPGKWPTIPASLHVQRQDGRTHRATATGDLGEKRSGQRRNRRYAPSSFREGAAPGGALRPKEEDSRWAKAQLDDQIQGCPKKEVIVAQPPPRC